MFGTDGRNKSHDLNIVSQPEILLSYRTRGDSTYGLLAALPYKQMPGAYQ